MQLQIRGQESSVVDCEEHEMISQIKERMATLHNLRNAELTLSCEGRVLEDDFVISDLPSDRIDLTVSLLGGKVHGSLARAGKVRSQTPKVEKTEKKKKKTGRAKRRMQYNRRFVNVPQTNGPRRGPNSNSN